MTLIETPKIERIIAHLGDHSILGLCADLMHRHKITEQHRLTVFIEDQHATADEISYQMEQARQSYPLFTILGYRRVPDDAWRQVPK